MAESGPLPGSGRICASTEKLTGWVSKKGRIRVNTNKWQNPRHYRDLVKSMRVPKNWPVRYWKRAESGGLLGSGRIRASTEKMTDRGLEKGRIRVNSDKWQNPRHYRDQIESMRVSKNWPVGYWKRVEFAWRPINGRIRGTTGIW